MLIYKTFILFIFYVCHKYYDGSDSPLHVIFVDRVIQVRLCCTTSVSLTTVVVMTFALIHTMVIVACADPDIT